MNTKAVSSFSSLSTQSLSQITGGQMVLDTDHGGGRKTHWFWGFNFCQLASMNNPAVTCHNTYPFP